MSMASSTKSLKIKIIVKKSDPSTLELAKPSLTEVGHAIAANRSEKSELGIVKSCGAHGSDDRKTVKACYGKQLQSICGIKCGSEEMIDRRGVKRGPEEMINRCGIKRGPEETIDRCSGKRPKLDQIMVRKCFMILKKLMTHPYGQGFNQPVDPVAYNIPDYFSIISKPMDLGTIKSKLVKDRYATADEFEADIRLTFSNAMLYNPPGNPFHKMAQELNSLFSAQWRLLRSIMKRESSKSKADNVLDEGKEKLEDMDSGCRRMCTPHSKASPRRSSLATEKINVKGSKQESVRKVPAKKFRTITEENQISKAASKLSSSSALSLGAKSSTKKKEPKEKNESLSIGKKVSLSSTRTSDLKAPSDLKKDGTESRTQKRRPTDSIKKMEPKEKNEPSIGKKVPLSSAKTSDLKAPSSDLKFLETLHEVANNRKPLDKSDSYANSKGIFEGALSWLDKEPTFDNHHASFTPAFDCNDWRSPLCEFQLSPAKAYRAEMLKRRFADTILKAQKLTHLCPGEKIDQVKMEVEMQRLERHHAEEKLKTEDGFKASQDRQREREAARIALEKMERSVEFEDNISSLRDLAYMIGDFSFAGPLRGYGGMYVSAKQFVDGKLKSPLERLGLYLKEEDDCMFGDEQGHDRKTVPEDCEEGEIII